MNASYARAFRRLTWAASILLLGCHRSWRSGVAQNDAESVRTSDGILVPLRLDRDSARTLVSRAFDDGQFTIDRDRSRPYSLVTLPHMIAGDTSMIVTAQVTPSDPADGASIVALSATYSVRSANIAAARVVESETSPTRWNVLRAFARSIRGPGR
jgi:hypothetical protein